MSASRRDRSPRAGLVRVTGSLHPSFVGAGALLAAGALLIASGCAGAEDQDVLLQGGASSSGTTPGSSGTSGAASSSGNNSSSGNSSSSGSTPGCTRETEPNDSREEANTLAPQLCGTLSGRDRRDFLTFRLKETTRSMSLRFEGSVRLKVEIDGKEAATLTPSNAGAVPFAMNSVYTIEVESLTDSDRPIDWLVEVIEK